jgi:hypothetical protein
VPALPPDRADAAEVSLMLAETATMRWAKVLLDSDLLPGMGRVVRDQIGLLGGTVTAQEAEDIVCAVVHSLAGEAIYGDEEHGSYVLRELRLTQRKCERLRTANRELEASASHATNVELRDDLKRCRKALSNIRYRVDSGGDLDPDTLRSIADAALDPKDGGA